MRRRTLLRAGAAGLALPWTVGWTRPLLRERGFVLSEHGCGRATGYAEANKIVTRDGRRHVAWLDSEDGRFLVRIRTRDEASGEWSDPVTIGEAVDNHGGPALAQDEEGYLHVVYGPHHHPFRYRRSRRPNDASAWTGEERFGERCTYPTLVVSPDGSLLCSGRVRGEGPWEVRAWRRPPEGDWGPAGTWMRAERRGYAHFQEALAWGPGRERLHLAARFYDGDRGHTVAHACSEDGGGTWFDGEGAELPRPFTAADTAPVRQDRDTEGTGLRCGALAVDGEGRPHLLVSSYDAVPMETWLYSESAPGESAPGRWTKRRLRDDLPESLADQGLALPGGITFTADGTCVLALTLIRPEEAVGEVSWGHPSSEVVLLRAPDPAGPFEVELPTDPDPTRPRWLPNLERPTGGAPVARPALIHTDGGRGAGNRDILSNRVLYHELEA